MNSCGRFNFSYRNNINTATLKKKEKKKKKTRIKKELLAPSSK